MLLKKKSIRERLDKLLGMGRTSDSTKHWPGGFDKSMETLVKLTAKETVLVPWETDPRVKLHM